MNDDRVDLLIQTLKRIAIALEELNEKVDSTMTHNGRLNVIAEIYKENE